MKKSESFKCKANIRVKAAADANTKETELAVPLECLSNLWRSLSKSNLDMVEKLCDNWFSDTKWWY